MNPDWKLIVPAIIAALVAVIGWFAANWLNAARERANKKRELGVQYLVESYRRLASCVNREQSREGMEEDFESAMTDIQLFGTLSQIAKAKDFMRDFARTRNASLDDLLLDLRNELRQELGLPAVEGKFLWLRIRVKSAKDEAGSKHL